MEISLIVPVFNVENYVERCLKSLLNQDLDKNDYEIIVVNDGSTDKSLDVVNKIARQNSNIIVYSQNNAGLSAARNKGLSLAKGDYVWFIDSDDWIKENCLHYILSTIKENNLEAFCIRSVFGASNNWKDTIIYKYVEKYSGRDFLMKDSFSECCPFTIYKKSVLKDNNLHFYEGIYHEDNEFTPRAYYFVKQIMATNEVFYFHFQNPNSITQKSNPKKSHDLITVGKSLDKFSKSVEQTYKQVYHRQISRVITSSLFFSMSYSKEEKKKLNMALFKEKHLFSHLLQSSYFKHKIAGILFILFPKKYTSIIKLFSYIK